MTVAQAALLAALIAAGLLGWQGMRLLRRDPAQRQKARLMIALAVILTANGIILIWTPGG
ncbi:MAG: hypothetical protein ACFB22_11920 [Rhodothalassiaceae bacterium]